MPTYLCSGAVCRVRTVRAFFIFKYVVIHTEPISQALSAPNESVARNLFWNNYIRPMLFRVRWQKQVMRVREMSHEELERLLAEARQPETT